MKVGDKVKLNGCPFDEQIPEELEKYMSLKDKTMKVIEVNANNPTLIKTNLTSDDWICDAWFKKVRK